MSCNQRWARFQQKRMNYKIESHFSPEVVMSTETAISSRNNETTMFCSGQGILDETHYAN